MFNKDNIEHVTQVKQDHVVFRVFVWQRWRHIPKFSLGKDPTNTAGLFQLHATFCIVHVSL